MPMIDVCAPAGAFQDKHKLARRLAATVMAVEVAAVRRELAQALQTSPAGEGMTSE